MRGGSFSHPTPISSPVVSTWPVDRTCLPELPAADDPDYPAKLAERQAAEDTAAHILWALSGRQYGSVEWIARPCPTPPCDPSDTRPDGPRFEPIDAHPRPIPGDPHGSGTYVTGPLPHDPPGSGLYVPVYPGSSDGEWVFNPCGCSGGLCQKAGPRAVHLPGPVAGIIDVTIAGVELAPEEYRLEGDTLYRIGADWPGQDLNRPLPEAGTWSVTYLRGWQVPAGVGRLTGLLAKELIAACTGGKCRLPRTVVSTTQRGVTHTFDPTRLLGAGKTGIPEVDLWLAAVNPHRLMSAPVVL